MKKKVFVIFALINWLLLNSQTVIPAGLVSGNWDLAGSPYNVEGDIQVIFDSLVIEPGVIVEFQGHFKFEIGLYGIGGQLIAIGTEQDSILFTCLDPDIGWGGLRFYNEETWCDSSKVKYGIIEFGKATGNNNNSKGGAVFCENYSKLELSYSNITNNYTEHDNGGVIYLENSTPNLHHLLIQNNENGGIFSNDNSASLSNSEILNNTEYGVSQLYQLEESIVDGHDNIGIINTNYVKSCIISNNDYGIQNALIIEDCLIINNYEGVYLYFYPQHTDIINCKIVNNNRAIYADTIELDVINTLIANNNNGIIVYYWETGDNTNFTNCTITNNLNLGLAITVECLPDPSRMACTVLNSVFWNNGHSDIGATTGGSNYQVLVDFSCIEDNLQNNITVGYNCITNNPNFINPTSGIGINYNALNADWSLSSNSLCINHGTSDTIGLNLPEYDLAGNPRIYQGDNPRIDIGSYEFQGEPDPVPEIEIIPEELNFGSWLVNNYSDIFESNIYNIGFTPLVIDSITAPEGFFIKRVDDPDFVSTIPSFSIEIDNYEQLQAIFLPESVIAYDDSIKVYSNDPDEYISTIAVSGEGTIVDTTIQGIISEDIVIENDINVIGDVTVADGITLTILSGVNVNVTGFYSINIQGRLLAIGTEQDTIYFSREDNLWSGINFINTPATNDSSKIIYCKITKAAGGAIEVDSFNKVTISNCTIRNNRRTDHGGGINCLNAELSIKNSNICRNLANRFEDESTCGGSIYLEDSYLKLSNCIISRSFVYGDYEWSGGAGAGMYIINSSCDMTNCEIYGNYSVGNGGPSYGGGIWAYYSQLIINNSIIRNNDMNCGAGMYADESDLRITNSLICNNTSESQYEGDGITCGGDVYIEIYNTTFYSNDGYGFSGGGDNLFFSNCIFRDNFYNQLGISGGYGGHGMTTADLSYNSIENGYNGITIGNPNWVTLNWLEGNIEDDPFFIDPENDDFHFFADSPCINTGTPDTIGLNLPEYDLDGNPRIYEDRIDMGCYEWQGTGSKNNEFSTAKVKLNNFPNPFNPTTTIEFSIHNDSEVALSIFNIKGQKIKPLLNDQIPAGEHSIVWKGEDDNNKPVSSGIYLYKLIVNGRTEAVKKCLLLK